jgi:hypothetical protein
MQLFEIPLKMFISPYLSVKVPRHPIPYKWKILPQKKNDIVKLPYLALTNISKIWTMPIKDWKSALNQFSIILEERLQNF